MGLHASLFELPPKPAYRLRVPKGAALGIPYRWLGGAYRLSDKNRCSPPPNCP
jgi:hypothetical protein